jgi:hypothetical protein
MGDWMASRSASARPSNWSGSARPATASLPRSSAQSRSGWPARPWRSAGTPPPATTPTTSPPTRPARRGTGRRLTRPQQTCPPSSAASSSPPDFGALGPTSRLQQKSRPSAWPGRTPPRSGRKSRAIAPGEHSDVDVACRGVAKTAVQRALRLCDVVLHRNVLDAQPPEGEPHLGAALLQVNERRRDIRGGHASSSAIRGHPALRHKPRPLRLATPTTRPAMSPALPV